MAIQNKNAHFFGLKVPILLAVVVGMWAINTRKPRLGKKALTPQLWAGRGQGSRCPRRTKGPSTFLRVPGSLGRKDRRPSIPGQRAPHINGPAGVQHAFLSLAGAGGPSGRRSQEIPQPGAVQRLSAAVGESFSSAPLPCPPRSFHAVSRI